MGAGPWDTGQVRAWRRKRRQPAPSSAPDTICLLPWLNLSIDVDGSSRPCCKFDHTADVNGQPLLNLETATLAEVWDSPGLVQLRTEFAEGKKPAGCASCWSEEASGIPSFRQMYLQDRCIEPDADITNVHPPQPKGLDLKLSNTCNLACRICGPVASSRWLKEELAAQPADAPRSGFVAYLTDNRRYLADNKLTGRTEDRATLEAWAPNVEHLELTGGEPMLSKESAEVLELLVAAGRPERITLQITTNATTISRRITDHLDRFRRVTISLSVDDIGPRLEYQRDPAVWSEVEANIAEYAAMASASVHIYLNATLSTLNAWDLPDYLAWWNATYPDRVNLALNILHNPEEQCVQNLPEPVKAAMFDHWDRHPARRLPRVAPLLDQAAGFATARQADPEQWQPFLRSTREIDARRGQHFESVYPELTEVLRSLGAWTPTEAGT